MLKLQDKIVKKGDYYQIQALQETLLISKARRQQTPIVTSTNIPASQYISTEIPTFKQARSKYFTSNLYQQYRSKGIRQLKSDLQNLLTISQENINDQDSKQIEQLLRQINEFKDSKELPLNNLSIKNHQLESVKKSSAATIELTANYNLSKIEEKIKKLEELDFPDLQNLQHQLEIMIGEKKPLPTVVLDQMDQKSKEQLNNIYHHLKQLQILNNLSTNVDKITYNQDKFDEMTTWVQKNTNVSNFNADFLLQLKMDQDLIDKLQTNFLQNIAQVKDLIKQIKN